MSEKSRPDAVQAEMRGRLGIITLDRPEALNALNLDMVEKLEEVLAGWATNPAVDAVVIRSASPRAFCAGGDVRSIGMLPDPSERRALGRKFFGREYKLNLRIHTFPKPFIALINGIAMGGGLGLSVHGSHRVVSEDLRLAMPETMLGLFPDVGGTWFLNRCPGMLGRYLAMTGLEIGAADALTARLATHHVPKAGFDGLVSALEAAGPLDRHLIDEIIEAHAAVPAAGQLAERLAAIDHLFAGNDLDLVMDRIASSAGDAEWIAQAQSALRRASPTSLRLTWRRMTNGRDQSIEQVLADDFHSAVRVVGGHDFAEGVRAILIDKDGASRWNPPELANVTKDDIDALLAPLDG